MPDCATAANPLTHNCVLTKKKVSHKVENALVGNYFKRAFRLRDAQGNCGVYFRHFVAEPRDHSPMKLRAIWTSCIFAAVIAVVNPFR